MDVLIFVLIVTVPLLTLMGVKKSLVLRGLGPVFLCYLLGFLLQFILPVSGAAMSVAEILVPLAIPLILFGAQFSHLKTVAKPMIRSLLLSIFSISAISLAGYSLFQNKVENASDISGMLVGLYTGGTPNLMAIGMALEVPETTIILTNTADLVAGGIYFLLLLSVIPRLYRHFLPSFPESPAFSPDVMKYGEVSYKDTPTTIKSYLLLFLLTILSLGLSAGVAILFTGTLHVAIIMLGVTTLGVAGSFHKKIRQIPGSYTFGKYLILMFSFAIGLSFDLSSITGDTWNLLFLLFFVQFGTIILHTLLSALFRIDRDTTIIASTACIFGPAFIIPVADALKNKAIILPGLVLGIVGYAMGNYLGIFMAYILNLVF